VRYFDIVVIGGGRNQPLDTVFVETAHFAHVSKIFCAKNSHTRLQAVSLTPFF
jgi:hypothetical protein